MKDENKTKKQLINELLELRQRIAELEKSEEQHKLLEQVLNEREQKIRNIIEHSNEIFYAHDTHHKLTYISPQSIQILGYSPDEMMTEWTNLITENPTNEIGIEITNKALKTGEKQKPYLLELYGKDGSKVLLEIEESPLKDKDGNVIGIVGAARDITDRKRAEKALIDSEEQYRRMVSAITTYTYSVEVKDGQAISTHHSIGCLPVIGYKPEDYESEPYLWYTMIHPEDQILVGNSLNEILAGREVPPIEHRLIRLDGSIVWVRNTMVPYTDEEGQLIRYDGLIEDITERKRAEEELGAEKNKLQSMIDAMEYGLTIQDLDYNIIYQNEVLRNVFGDRLGEKCYQVYEGKDKICDGCPVEMAYKDGKSHTSERRIKMPSGEIAFWENTANPIGDTRGKIVSCLEITRNITQRKIAEKALQESEQNYRSLFEESKDVVYISTPEGNFLDINPAGVELFGYSSKEEILQIDITRDLYANPGDREYFQQILAKQGYAKDYEVVFKRKDGEQLIVLLTTTAVHGENGNTIAYRGIIKDITKWKRLEQQFLQAQKMEAIGQLAGGVAHDFNNILTAIIGYGSLLKIETSEDELMGSYVTQILNSAERAANLTKALLAFSRRQIIRPKPVNLNEIITVLEKLLSRLIGEDIELSTALTDKDLTVMADSTQMEQVLMNLATNARDAMPDGGSLTIGTELVELNNEFIKAHGFGRPGFCALISFEDTGQGMDEKTKEKIFEPFFTTKEVGKGTGLGLAMVYGIIKQHNGYINVYSEPVKGTTFKIYLPLIKSKVEEVKLANLSIIKGGIETILVAEDDAQVRELTKEVLEGFGYKVMEATDGDDATKIFNENKDKIQLLFLDVIMPKKNGKEVYDEIKKVRPDIKAIFTSGYNADIIHKKGILEEGLDFITKPISPDELLRMVREVLDK